MSSNKGKFAIGALIALGLYFVCSILTAFLNVLVAFTAGYDSFAAFQDAADSISGILIVLIVGIANHLFFSWLTVRAMFRYAKKKQCLSNGYYRTAAAVIFIFASVILPAFTGSHTGWITYTVHVLGIDLFGKQLVKKESYITPSEQDIPQNAAENEADSTPQKFFFCENCGAKLLSGSTICKQCGEKVRERSLNEQ